MKSYKLKEKKKIIPCFYGFIYDDRIKWDLTKYQGIEFEDKYDLAFKLYKKIDEDNMTIAQNNGAIVHDPSINAKISREVKKHNEKNPYLLRLLIGGIIGAIVLIIIIVDILPIIHHDSSSSTLSSIPSLSNPPNTVYSFVNQWGHKGAKNGQFKGPEGVTGFFW